MRLTHFGGTALPTASEEVNTPVAARSTLLELPNGAFDLDGNETILRPPTITRRFKITSSIDATIDTLLAKFHGGRKILKALLRDGVTYRQTFAKVVAVDRPRQRGDVNYQQLDVTWQQDYPYWLASVDEPKYLDNGEVLDAGWNLDGQHSDVTIDAVSESLTINNTGSLPIRRGQIVVKPAAASATLTDLLIVNAANQMQLRWTDTVTYPEVLVLDILSKSAKKDAVNVYQFVQIPEDQMDWMQLETGSNALAITCASRAGNVTFEYHWSKHYL